MTQKTVIAVLEDQRSLARPWLRNFRRRKLGEAPDENLFTTAAEALAWVLGNTEHGWVLLVDIDLEGDVLESSEHPTEAEALKNARELLRREQPVLARFTGAVLLRHLLELEESGTLPGARRHVLVVTAQALTVLARWLEENRFTTLIKPVLGEDLTDAVSGRIAALREKEVERGS